MQDIKGLWKLNVVASALNHCEIKNFDDWLEGIKNQADEEQEDVDPVALLERVKKDIGKV